MAWIGLILAGLFEVVWAIGLKHSEGFTRLWPSVITGLAMLASLYFLGIILSVDSFWCDEANRPSIGRWRGHQTSQGFDHLLELRMSIRGQRIVLQRERFGLSLKLF
jgi:hypothetical protein